MKTLNKVLIGSGIGIVLGGIAAGYLLMRRRQSSKRQEKELDELDV